MRSRQSTVHGLGPYNKHQSSKQAIDACGCQVFATMHPTSQRQRSAATASCINTASRCSRASASACLSLAPTHVSVCRSVFSSVLDTSVCLRYSRATDCTAHGASQVCAYHTWRSRCQFLLHASSFCCSLIRAFSCTGCHSSQIKSCPPTLNPDINQNLNNQPCNHNTHTHTHIHTHTHTPAIKRCTVCCIFSSRAL